jgi:hypothetical protein
MSKHTTDVEVSDRIAVTRVGRNGSEWALYPGAAGTVTEVLPGALIVAWDDPALAAHEVPLCVGMGDAWAVTDPAAPRPPRRGFLDRLRGWLNPPAEAPSMIETGLTQ